MNIFLVSENWHSFEASIGNCLLLGEITGIKDIREIEFISGQKDGKYEELNLVPMKL